MDRAMLERHLAMADRHVTDGDRIIDRQRDLTLELSQDGHHHLAGDAQQLLALFEGIQISFVNDRDRMRSMLDQWAENT